MHRTESCVIIPKQRIMDTLRSHEDSFSTDFVLYVVEHKYTTIHSTFIY
jgi:hypothetical protein